MHGDGDRWGMGPQTPPKTTKSPRVRGHRGPQDPLSLGTNVDIQPCSNLVYSIHLHLGRKCELVRSG